jgi:transposase
MLGAMLYVLRTSLQWTSLPHEIGASTTVDDRFRAWEADGFFGRWWVAWLAEFDQLVGIDWECQRLDGVMTNAPFGRVATAEAEGIGHHPTDRGKHGTKRSTLSEGHGLPLAVVVAGANGYDLKLAAPTLDAGMKTTCHALPPNSVAPSLISARVAKCAPTPARAIPSRHHDAGWWSGSTAGSLARAGCWSVGKRWSAALWPSCSWSVSSSALASERRTLGTVE